MRKRSSYQDRLRDIDELRAANKQLAFENREMKIDIFNLIGENGWAARASSETKWKQEVEKYHSEKYGKDQLRLFGAEDTMRKSRSVFKIPNIFKHPITKIFRL